MSIVELSLAADAANWQALGSSIDSDGCTTIGGTRIRLVPRIQGAGLLGWGLDAADVPSSIDGITTWPALAPAPAAASEHPLGASGIDHLVVSTPDLERTCAAISSATGAPLRRVREVGSMRQGFHRVGELVVEVVTHPGVADGPAVLWGLVLTVEDLDAAAARLTDGLGPIKHAVQPGRRIATVRSSLGLGCPVALITPHVRAAS